MKKAGIASRSLAIPARKGRLQGGSLPVFRLRAAHTISTVVAQIAVAVSYRDRSAVIATRRVALKTRELFTAISVGHSCQYVDRRLRLGVTLAFRTVCGVPVAGGG